MRHRVYGKHLGRNKDERDRLFKSLIASLFLYGTIETSEAKAKAVKGLVDKVLNLAKSKDTHRLLQSYINKSLEERVIKDIVPKLGNKNSGYTSLVKLGTRLGDRTMMVKMSLIGAEKLEPIKKVDRLQGTVDSKKDSSTKSLEEVKTEEKVEKVVEKQTKAKKVKTETKGAKKS